MIIFGKEERDKFEANRASFSQSVRDTYDNATTYRDGKWVMFIPEDDSLFPDIERMLQIKRRPNASLKSEIR